MTHAKELFDAGNLANAMEACKKQVRDHPDDSVQRFLLCELLAFTGELEKIEDHLKVVASVDATRLPTVSLWRRLVAAQKVRRSVLGPEGKSPEVFADVGDEVGASRALALLRAGDPPGARAALSKDPGAAIQGLHGGREFVGFRDLDDVLAGVLEVFGGDGRYGWVPFEALKRLEVERPQSMRELVWAQARLVLRDGRETRVFLPTRYDGSEVFEDPLIILGRATDWMSSDASAPVRGLGLKCFQVGDAALNLFELETVTFQAEALWREEGVAHG